MNYVWEGCVAPQVSEGQVYGGYGCFERTRLTQRIGPGRCGEGGP